MSPNDPKVIASITDLLTQIKTQVASLEPEMLRIKIVARLDAITLAMNTPWPAPTEPKAPTAPAPAAKPKGCCF